MTRIQLPLTAALALLLAAPAAAQEGEKDLGTFKDWQAVSYTEGGKPVCTMYSRPTKSEGDYEKRGDVYVFVTHRPSANRTDEISLKIGYTFQAGAPVEVLIGGTKYDLFSKENYAWARSNTEDRTLVRAMRAGATMVIKGVSSRGTQTTDTFSLSGFTAAYNAITSACRVR